MSPPPTDYGLRHLADRLQQATVPPVNSAQLIALAAEAAVVLRFIADWLATFEDTYPQETARA